MAGNKIFRGLFAGFVWRDEKNGKSIFLLEINEFPGEGNYKSHQVKRDAVTNQDEDWYTIVCNSMKTAIPSYEKNTPLKVSGQFFVDNPQYKPSFMVDAVEMSTDDERIAIQYLSYAMKSKRDAMHIVSTFGADIFSLASQEDAVRVIKERTGIDELSVAKLVNDIRKTAAERHLFEFLAPIGVPFPYCIKAVKQFGQYAETYLRQNPYICGRRLGLSFYVCDRIAKAAWVPTMDEERIEAAAEATLREMSTNGDTMMDETRFKKVFNGFLGQEALKENSSLANSFPFLDEKVGSRVVDRAAIQFFSKALDEAERRIAKNLVRIGLAGGLASMKKDFDYGLVQYAERLCNMKYGRQQRSAFPILLGSPGIKILTGGPGTGKTTTLKGILLAYQKMHPQAEIKLCAPTGRAAQKMSESTGFEAVTIHRLVGYSPYTDTKTTKFNAHNQLSADLIVVDECSMLDVVIFDMLLEAIKTGSTVFLIGDPNQLEAVGAGSILHDILHTDYSFFSKATLSDVFRQKGGSPIIENALKTNSGDVDLVWHQQFQIINSTSPEESLEYVKRIVAKEHIPSDPYAVQVLTPTRKGPVGVDNLNRELQAILNPCLTKNRNEVIYGQKKFRPGDKVIMMRNNYDPGLEYYNGDIGTVVATDDGHIIVNLRGREVDINRGLLDEIDHSFAMTIHKSQGSDFPTVIVVLPQEPSQMLVRNLFYTGITRAKSQIFVINENHSIERAIRNNKYGTRLTRLREYIKEAQAQMLSA